MSTPNLPVVQDMDELPVFAPSKDLAERWRWRDRFGAMHRPKEMPTRHLFYVLRMIWNNTMPAFMQVGANPKRYRFPAFYHHRYMAEAICVCGAELLGRDDLERWQRAELAQMRAWLERRLEHREVRPAPPPLRLVSP